MQILLRIYKAYKGDIFRYVLWCFAQKESYDALDARSGRSSAERKNKRKLKGSFWRLAYGI
jgi:hypothetical protein